MHRKHTVSRNPWWFELARTLRDFRETVLADFGISRINGNLQRNLRPNILLNGLKFHLGIHLGVQCTGWFEIVHSPNGLKETANVCLELFLV